jgi:hypothetical protein
MRVITDETNDLPPVITVDWEAVEATIGERVAPAVREVIEHTGGTDPCMLDKWGYAAEATPALFSAVKAHARLIHPDRGLLDARYAPLWSIRAAISALKTLRGEELHTGPVIEDGDDSEFVDGLADLYDAVRTLDECRDDWHEDQHPRIAVGSFGPDKLGSHYIRVGHDDRSIIDGIDVENLPIEREHVVARRDYWNSTEEYVTASFRHERYYPEGRHVPVEKRDR